MLGTAAVPPGRAINSVKTACCCCGGSARLPPNELGTRRTAVGKYVAAAVSAMEGKGPAADAAPLDCGLSVTLQTRPSDFDREFVIRYSAIAEMMQDIRSEKSSSASSVLALADWHARGGSDGGGGTRITTSSPALLCKTA
eukprot:COSAG03_NODE_2936_length_2344_cov_1.594209_2_plen_141_part_00